MITMGSPKGHFASCVPAANQTHKNKADLGRELKVKAQKYRSKTKTFTWNEGPFPHHSKHSHGQDTGNSQNKSKDVG